LDLNNLNALLGAGKALAQLGNEDQIKESKKYLNQFINLAPDSNPQKMVAKEILKGLGD
jgi:hypothetical protein